MKLFVLTAQFLIIATVFSGCATTNVASRQEYNGPKIAKPNLIIVHNFAATPADVPSWAGNGQSFQQSMPQTTEDITTGRQLGAEVAKELTTKIQAMGLNAEQVADRFNPSIGNLVITGYFDSVNSGNAAERVAIGFGSGAASLNTVVEGFLMTDHGLRKLGSGDVDAGGSKSPGTAFSLASAVATGNPVGLIVSSAVKIEGEESGKSTVEGAAKRTADKIAQQLQLKFREQGWID